MPLIAELLITQLRNLSEQEEEPNPWLTSDHMIIHEDNSHDNPSSHSLDAHDENYFCYSSSEMENDGQEEEEQEDQEEDYNAMIDFIQSNEEHSENEDDFALLDERFYDPTHKSAGKLSVIKKGSSYIALFNNWFRFQDIILYMPPGSSFDSFLKAFKSESKKWIFPFAQLTSYESLKGPIPKYPSSAWYNELKAEDALDAEYQKWKKSGSSSPPPMNGQEKYNEILQLCQDNNYTTLLDYLRAYNISDVSPALSALSKMQDEFFTHGIDMLMEACTVAGIARSILFKYAQRSNTLFPLMGPRDADLHYMIKESICGGVSAIYTRMCIKGETFISPEKSHITQAINVYDANSLYLYCIEGAFISKTYVRRHVDNNYKPCIQSRLIKQHVWLRFVQEKTGRQLKTVETCGQDITFGKYRADAMFTDANNVTTIYEFKGKHSYFLLVMKIFFQPMISLL